MIEIDATNVLEYLAGPGKVHWEPLELDAALISESTAVELAWGVSNIVIRVDTPVRSFVVKQSRQQLRTSVDWFSQLDRIWREVDVLRCLESLLPAGAVPRVLSENRDHYLFVMEAVEADHRVWKAELLSGVFDSTIAETLANHLAVIHRESTGQPKIADALGDQTVFDELRLDPFYRYVARTCPEFSHALTELIDKTSRRRDCLVLADFSPKNILLTSTGPVIVDFETGHYGDPGFDIGFFLSHLLLKTVLHHERASAAIAPARAFWQTFLDQLNSKPAPAWLHKSGLESDFECRSTAHLAACMLARIDGKSRVDYLTEPWQPELVRSFSRRLIAGEVTSIEDAFDLLVRTLHSR